MKVLTVGIKTNPVTEPAAYNQARPFYSKRLAIRNDPLNAIPAVGVIPNQFYDVFDDTGATIATGTFATPNGRLFQSKGFVGAVLTVSAYSYNVTTGEKGPWLGDLKFTFAAAATNTLRSIIVDDTNSASMIFSFTSIHTTAANGGLFGVWGVPISDFVTSSFITYPYATTIPSLTKTVYKCVDVIAANTITTAVGHDFDNTVGGTISSYYVFNNTAALPKIYKFNMSTPPSGTVLAGEASSNFTLATGTFTALSGAIITASNSIRIGKLGAGHGGGSLNGFACLTYMTSTNIYAAKLSDITNGATTLPSQITTTTSLDAVKYANAYATPTISFGSYDQLTDKFYCLTSTGRMLVKKIINNDPKGSVFGSNDVIKGETGNTGTPNEFGGITTQSLAVQNGWLFMAVSSVGQRGVYQMDAASDASNLLSFVLTPVLTVNKSSLISLFNQVALGSLGTRLVVGYRTSNFSVDPNAGLAAFFATFTFANVNTGSLAAVTGFNQVQLVTLFPNQSGCATNVHQIVEQYLVHNDPTQISDNWAGSVDNSTQNAQSPMYVSFRLKSAYSSLPTKFVIYGVDDSNNTVFTFDTVANASQFSWTNNNGTSYTAWTNMASFPNVALTSELRLLVPTPSGTRITWGIQEG